MVTEKDLFSMLSGLGIRHDDRVAVHSSLRSIGPFENGADGLIDAFKKYLCDGLLLVPTHTWETVCRENPVFDIRTAVPCIGTLPSVAAFRPDGFRSLHPTHSVTVFGKGAEEYAQGDERCHSPTPPGCVLSRLYDDGGKILLIGVDHTCNTYLHFAEERANVPYRVRKHGFTVSVTDRDGRTQEVEMHTHANPASDYFMQYKDALDCGGAVTYSTLGSAKVFCCDARRTADIVFSLWQEADYDLTLTKREIPEIYYKKR